MEPTNLPPQNQIYPEVQPQSNSLSPLKPAAKSISPIIIGILIGIFFTAVSAFAFIFITRQNNPNISVLPTPFPQETTKPTAIPTSSLPIDSTEFKFQKPALVANLPVFPTVTASDNSYIYSEAKTYLVASNADGDKLYDILLPYMGPGEPGLYRIVQKSNNFYYLTEGMDNWVKKEVVDGKVFSSNVKAYDKTISVLTFPEKFKLSNGASVTASPYGFNSKRFKSDLTSPTTVENSQYGEILVEYVKYTDSQNKQVNDFYTRSFYLVLPDSYLVSLKASYDFFNDDKAPSVNWSDNSTYNQVFTDSLHTKCGAPLSSDVLRITSLPSDAKAVGSVYHNAKSSSIFQITDVNSPVISLTYNQYKVGRDYPSAPPILPIDQYIQKKNHFLWQDPFGDWSIFVSQEFAPMAECGKPVIYLYPPKDTAVNVKVGADMTQSIPQYPSHGWKVLAKSNGELTYDNQTYPYLFWEGQGRGIYPNLHDYGIVVTQKDVVSTLKSQLSSLGLNQKESSDFMEFWQSKLPHTPYVRLTWLGTRDMDALAPLTVSPSPDTRIRIFLEFEGLNQYKKLIPQNLSAPARTGFTLVEWGGLLVKNN